MAARVTSQNKRNNKLVKLFSFNLYFLFPIDTTCYLHVKPHKARGMIGLFDYVLFRIPTSIRPSIAYTSHMRKGHTSIC